MYKEVNTGGNLPKAQIVLYLSMATSKFLCVAKAAVQQTKRISIKETKALLTGKLKNFLVEKKCALGTAACPPYHIALSWRHLGLRKRMKTVKLASTHYYDALPTEGNEHGRAFRDLHRNRNCWKKRKTWPRRPVRREIFRPRYSRNSPARVTALPVSGDGRLLLGRP